MVARVALGVPRRRLGAGADVPKGCSSLNLERVIASRIGVLLLLLTGEVWRERGIQVARREVKREEK